MEKVKIIDVTLRDGGYKNNFTYSPKTIKHILMELDKSGIDYIEVGYRNGSFKHIPDIGPTGLCDRTYLEYCRKEIQQAKLTVILHPKNLQQQDYEDMYAANVECVRICFPNQNTALGFQAIKWAQRYSFEIFVNFTRMTHTSISELIQLISSLSNYNIKGIYLADSNGSLKPNQAKEIFTQLIKITHVPLGFHPHDNLSLAQANAITAIQQGVTFIDSSLYGYGKGVGNLKTEAIVSFLHASGVYRHDLCRLLDAANYVKRLSDEKQIPVHDIIMGVFDLSQDEGVHLKGSYNTYDYYQRAKHYLKQKNMMAC
jgi:4-hydroxy 2-oxovalerate aldolase